MSKLRVLSPESAEPLAQAFRAACERCHAVWQVDAASRCARAQARSQIVDGGWDALFLDGRFADLVRSAVKVQAASAQVAGGADFLFTRNGTSAAVNLFGAATTTFAESLGYSFGGSHVSVCGEGPRALALVQALAVAGADRIVLVSDTPRKSEEAIRLFLARYKRLAYAVVDLSPEEDHHRSFAEAYEQPRYQFGSYTTSRNALAESDYLFAVGEEPFFTSNPVPRDVFEEQVAVCHAGCAPAESGFAHLAKECGCTVLDGRGSLAWSVAQATAVLSQLHLDLPSDDAQDAVDVANAAPPCSLDDMFRAASGPLGLTC